MYLDSMARPSYTPSEEHLVTAYNGAKKGLSEAQIAEAIGISYSSLKRYKDQFLPHIKKGREESRDVDCKTIENTLVKRCTGYYVEETITEEKTLTTEGIPIITKRTTKKWISPSDVLTMFVLCNRVADRWQSINRPVIDPDASKGEIQGWFDKMKASYDEIKRKPKQDA